MGRRIRAEPRPAPPAGGPREVDLVVSRNGERWAVGPLGSRAQVSFATLEAAVTHARTFASTRSLDVWLTSDGVAYTRDEENGARGPAHR